MSDEVRSAFRGTDILIHDRSLSEAQVLSIVRHPNENLFQVAVNLVEEWERLESSPVTGQMDAGFRVPVLVRLTCNHDLTGLTFLLQSRLCSWVAGITSTWVASGSWLYSLLKRTAGRRPDGSFTCQITRGNAYATALSST
jgi:hypothetical protein